MVRKFQETHFWAVKVIKLTVNVRSYPMDTENNLLVRADSFNGLRYCHIYLLQFAISEMLLVFVLKWG